MLGALINPKAFTKQMWHWEPGKPSSTPTPTKSCPAGTVLMEKVRPDGSRTQECVAINTEPPPITVPEPPAPTSPTAPVTPTPPYVPAVPPTEVTPTTLPEQAEKEGWPWWAWVLLVGGAGTAGAILYYGLRDR